MGSSGAGPVSLAEQTPGVRRRALWRAGGRILLTWVVILGAYFLAPLGQDTSVQVVVRLVLDVTVVGLFIWWQSTRILRATYPELRAVQALGAVVVVFLALFSGLYVTMSDSAPATFSEPLNHVRALYFTTTVFATVGFGDITARTDAARAIVSAQMILDLILIGAVARLLLTVARTGLARAGRTDESADA